MEGACPSISFWAKLPCVYPKLTCGHTVLRSVVKWIDTTEASKDSTAAHTGTNRRFNQQSEICMFVTICQIPFLSDILKAKCVVTHEISPVSKCNLARKKGKSKENAVRKDYCTVFIIATVSHDVSQIQWKIWISSLATWTCDHIKSSKLSERPFIPSKTVYSPSDLSLREEKWK